MAITVASITDTKLSLIWRQQRVSEGLNQKLAAVPQGIVRGFYPLAGASARTLDLKPDALELDSVINAKCAGGYWVTYRETGIVSLSLISLAPNGTYYIGCVISYTVGASTTAAWKAYTAAQVTAGDPVTDGAVLICKITMPAGNTVLDKKKIKIGDTLFLRDGAGRNSGTQNGIAQVMSVDFSLASNDMVLAVTNGIVTANRSVYYSGLGSLQCAQSSAPTPVMIIFGGESYDADEGESMAVEFVYRTEVGSTNTGGITFGFNPYSATASYSETYAIVDTAGAFVTVRMSLTAIEKGEFSVYCVMASNNTVYLDSWVVYRTLNRVNGNTGTVTEFDGQIRFGNFINGDQYYLYANGNGFLAHPYAGATKTFEIGSVTYPLNVDMKNDLLVEGDSEFTGMASFTAPFGSNVGSDDVYWERTAANTMSLTNGATATSTKKLDTWGIETNWIDPTSIVTGSVGSELRIRDLQPPAANNVAPVGAFNTPVAMAQFTFNGTNWAFNNFANSYGFTSTMGTAGALSFSVVIDTTGRPMDSSGTAFCYPMVQYGRPHAANGLSCYASAVFSSGPSTWIVTVEFEDAAAGTPVIGTGEHCFLIVYAKRA